MRWNFIFVLVFAEVTLTQKALSNQVGQNDPRSQWVLRSEWYLLGHF